MLPRTVGERFREVARCLPDTPALVSPEGTLTFREADEQADRVAAAVVDRLGTGPEPVATLLPHSVDGLLGLLAGLRTGRPVVALDVMVPPPRLAQIMQHAGCAGLLTDTADPQLAGIVREMSEHLDGGVGPIVDLSAARGAASPLTLAGTAGTTGGGASAALAAEAARTISDPACIVFTSGSTGTPKGVIWTHGTLLNDAYAGAERMHFGPGDRVALVLPYSFAAGLTVVVFGLLNGAGVYAYDPRALGIRGLPDWIESQNLTTLHTTPSLLRSLTGALADGQRLGRLRLLTTCGEAVYGRDIQAVRPHLPSDCTYVNWSGASEIASLAFREFPPGEPIPDGVLPAGRPAAGKEVTVAREDGSPAGPGETGDLVVTSAYLSAGYWHAPPEVAARFTPLPDGRTSCRTGDLARFEPDGTLVLLGRRDAAVKIRGYLVEPSEVEAALLSSPSIADAVVTAVTDQDDQTRLVAYVVPAALEGTLSGAAVRRMLREKLPVWMVPATVVSLPELPRNERGKVDRKALPPPPPPSAKPADRIPTQWEIVVADLWMKVLNLERVDIYDDFMELGGDSLAANELLTLVSERLNVQLPSSTLVQAPTLAEFAERVEAAQRARPTQSSVVPLRTAGSRPPLFCFAGAGGLALGYLSLARRLGEDQPVYAFQAHGLEQRGFPDWTVERSARRHLRTIRAIQPHGPYLLVGHSLGGLIAMEAAHQLTAAGESVELLVMLDTYLPLSVRAEQPNGSGQQAAGQWPAPVWSLFQGNETTRNYAAKLAQFRRLLPERIVSVETLGKLAKMPLIGLVRYPGHTQFNAFFTHGRLLERFYRPRPWAGRTLVYRAADNPDTIEDWDRYLTGSREVFDIPCEHFSVLREPHVAQIAVRIEAEIDRILEKTGWRGRPGSGGAASRAQAV